MKILFLVPYPHNEAPSQRFRFEQYLTSLEQIQCKFTINPFLSRKGWNVFYSGNHLLVAYYLIVGFIKRIGHVLKATKYHYVFIHRELTPMGPPIFEWIISRILRKKIIYDFDDAIWLEDPNEKGSVLAIVKWKKKVAKICKWSHKVSAGNKFLAEYAKQFNQNVVLNPTTIDTENWHNPELLKRTTSSVNTSQNSSKTKLVIGWTGSHSTLQYIDELLPTLRKLAENHHFNFKVIANRPPLFSLDNLMYTEWNKNSEIDDLADIDIGVMPLSEDLWSKGKCGFKALQYMSLKIPTIASPVGVNTEIIESDINGFLCQTQEQWYDALSTLLEDKVLRHRLGEKGREKIINNYSVLSNKENFLSLFGLVRSTTSDNKQRN